MSSSPLIQQWQLNAKTASKANKRFIKQIKAKKIETPVSTDAIHDAVFSEINCLECGNCCKTYNILLTEVDQKRISRFLGKDILEVLDQYHLMDDGQVLVQSLPCQFLGADNACSIYEVRPEVCRDYPFLKSHLFQKNRPHQIAENTLHCPATYHIFERLKAII